MRIPANLLCGAIVLTVVGVGAAAKAEQTNYLGMHPIQTGGFCYIEAEHVHSYAPEPRGSVLFRKFSGTFYFVGDPVPFLFDGPTYGFVGHHPIPVQATVGNPPNDHIEFCYLDGPHSHHYWPGQGGMFEYQGDAYWYMGPMPEAYESGLARYGRINAIYQPLNYQRPVVNAEAPAGYTERTSRASASSSSGTKSSGTSGKKKEPAKSSTWGSTKTTKKKKKKKSTKKRSSWE